MRLIEVLLSQKKFIFTLAAALTTVTASVAQAYIPQSQTIVSRLARNHGKGYYVIEQDVQFRTSTEPVILRERWIVENGENMRLSVSAPKAGADPIRYDAIYRDGKRTSGDLTGATRTLPVTGEFLEGFFHARSGRTFLGSLVKSRILPPQALREKPRVTKIEQIKYTPDPYIRLGRTAGVVTWIFGEPSPAEGKLNAQAWIEQDSFTLRRLRFATDAEVVAERHSAYAANLRFPRERTVSWGDNSVQIRVVSVKQIPASQVGSQLDPNQVTPAVAKAARLPDLTQVREFYSRFR